MNPIDPALCPRCGNHITPEHKMISGIIVDEYVCTEIHDDGQHHVWYGGTNHPETPITSWPPST